MSVKKAILDHVYSYSNLSSKEIYEGLNQSISYATVKRNLAKLCAENLISTDGNGKATKYKLSPSHYLHFPLDMEKYFEKEQDERNIQRHYNSSLLRETLLTENIFNEKENTYLDGLQKKFRRNISQLSKNSYDKEMERLAIDLSWKSSQIEGNTYSLLETEHLLKEKKTAAGKPKDDAIMLLNHKDAINFIIENPDYIIPLSISSIEDIHSLLIKELGVDRNIRQRRVGVSGTNYKPIDNEFHIREALEDLCLLINRKDNLFEKSFLTLILISYIQPFADGNKRTARIVSNAILLAAGYCPLSYRTADSIEYKKAMLIFYEQNNLNAIKNIFIDQFAFAVETYF